MRRCDSADGREDRTREKVQKPNLQIIDAEFQLIIVLSYHTTRDRRVHADARLVPPCGLLCTLCLPQRVSPEA